MQPALAEHAELPFELRCLEAALETALSAMAGETGALELHTSPLLTRASQKVIYSCIACSWHTSSMQSASQATMSMHLDGLLAGRGLVLLCTSAYG